MTEGKLLSAEELATAKAELLSMCRAIAPRSDWVEIAQNTWVKPVLDHITALTKERDEAQQTVMALTTCCCGGDVNHGPDEGHMPVSIYSHALKAAEAELARIRGRLDEDELSMFIMKESDRIDAALTVRESEQIAAAIISHITKE